MDKLSPAQERVMNMMIQGHIAVQELMDARVYIGGHKICRIDTISALRRLGLVESHQRWHWRATEKAKAEGK